MAPCSKKIINELCNHLGYDLEGNMCQELHAHIQVCDSCREYLASIRKTVTICKSASRQAAVPADIKQKLIEQMKNRHSSDK